MNRYSMRKYIIANWKMSMGKGEALDFAKALGDNLENMEHVQGVICPSFPLIGSLELPPSVALGAQNCSAFEAGAYTGEVSASLLGEMGCEYVIVGHSERRTLFGETSEDVRNKAMQVLACYMTPVVCIGESLEMYESGETKAYLKDQLEACLPDQNFILAYEPIWAIGTGRVPTLEEIEETQAFLKEVLVRHGLGETPVLYGGSVKGENAKDILALPSVDGVLVGGASLKIGSFLKIMRSVV